MPPRFFASPYKNALATPAKKEGQWSELPVSTSANTDASDLIATGGEYWVAQGSVSGSLVCLPYTEPGKFNQRAPTLQVASRAITAFDVSRFDDLIAAGTDDGKIGVHALPPLSSFSPGAPLAPTTLLTVTHPAAKAIDTVSFHPTTSSLLLASSGSIVAVYDAQSGAAEPAYKLDNGAAVWSAKWSADGRSVSTTGKDGKLRLFDVRSNQLAQETLAHTGLKCSRHVWLGSGDQIFTTGFSKMRNREYSLFDGRQLGSAIKTSRVDTGTGVLMPVVDPSRNIVYLAGRGDMTLRWVEVGGPSTFTEGGSPVPTTIASLALAPPSQLDLMKAEINRVLVLTSDAVVPVPINVPRRQYIDFHSDLFPAVTARTPAQDSAAWRDGKDGLCDLVPQDPSRKAEPVKGEAPAPVAAPTPAAAPAATLTSAPVTTLETPTTPSAPVAAAPAPAPAPAAIAPNQAAPPRSVASSSPRPTFSSKPAAAAASSTPTPVEAPSKPLESLSISTPPAPAASPGVKAATSAPAPSTGPYNPTWSRKFLLGRTPLKPDYHDVHGLSATMSADVGLLKASPLYFFFPLSGPGGRLAVHPISAVGRLPTLIPALVSGATVVEFELDPFDPTRVFVAADDSRVRVFELPSDGKGLAEDTTEVVKVLEDPKMDRIIELKHHPLAKGLLMTVSDDHGHPTVRLWDVEKGTVVLRVELPAGGVSSTAWSPTGSHIAVATKSKQLLILDPRASTTAPLTVASHSSPRPVRVAWLSPTHVLTTGFNRTASRELLLYSVTDSKVEQIASQSLDVSPAPLFPWFDPDTSILFLYSRGDRSCLAYEVHPEDGAKAFGKLPNFEHGTLQSGYAFMAKTRNDVKKVEIVKAYRLTPGTIETISFTVPRAKADFFQDDIFVLTRNTEKPAVSADEWIAGKNGELELVDLKPEGMTPLSQAPVAASKVSTRSKINGPQLTESQKAEAFMERLFQSAKEDGDEEEVVRSSHAPADDDDW